MNNMEPRHKEDSPCTIVGLIQKILENNDWPFETQEDEGGSLISSSVQGKDFDLELSFTWGSDSQVLYFTSVVNGLLVPEKRTSTTSDLCNLINEQNGIGTFFITTDRAVLRREHLILKDLGVPGITAEPIEAMLQRAADDWGHFYPAIQKVVWGGMSVKDAVQAAMLNPVGEA